MKKTVRMTVAVLTACFFLPVGCGMRTGVSGDKIQDDAVVTVAGRTISYGECGDGWGLVCDGETLIEDPTVNLYSVLPSVYAVDLVGRRREFNLKRKSSIEQMRDFGGPLSGFNRFSRSYEASPEDGGPMMSLRFVADFPDSSVTHRTEICDWLCSMIGDSEDRGAGQPAHYEGSYTDAAGLGDFIADNYFESMRSSFEFDSPDLLLTFARIVDWRARSYNGRYVTYREYCLEDTGGAHGMYSQRLITYDLMNHCVVTTDSLFSPGCEDEVVGLIYEALVSDREYRKWHDSPDEDQGVRETVEADYGAAGQTVGLTDEGAVFSFQPYEVGSFAEGCHHVTLPYDGLRPYLRPEILPMIGL